MLDSLKDQDHSLGSDRKSSSARQRPGTSSTEATDVLYELFTLLNEYSPSWYTEQHYQRAKDVLTRMGKL